MAKAEAVRLLLYTVGQASTRLNLARSTGYELVRNGALRSIRIPAGEGRAIRIPAQELDRFIEQQANAQAKK